MFEKVDGLVKPWEDALKIPSGSTSRQWIPELAASVLEIPIDVVAEPFGAKVAKAVGAFILSLAPQFAVKPLVGYAWSDRDTEDLHAIAKHWFAQVLDPSPEDLAKIAEAISELRAGFTFGDWTRIARAFGVKSPQVIKAGWDRVTSAWASAFGLPAAPPIAMPPTPPAAPLVPPIPPVTIEVPGFG